MSVLIPLADIERDRIEVRVTTNGYATVHCISLEDALTLAERLTTECDRLARAREVLKDLPR